LESRERESERCENTLVAEKKQNAASYRFDPISEACIKNFAIDLLTDPVITDASPLCYNGGGKRIILSASDSS
jgi:hypothetical protein